MSKPTGNPRRALGRGLNSLLPARSSAARAGEGGAVSMLAIHRIDPNPLQPRSAFPPEKLEELAASIRAHGILQPLLVRPRGGRFQLVAGERRWRAAQLAGLSEVPAIVQEVPDDRLLEFTLIENIQREDLNPMEIARAFERMHRELGLSHDEIARRTGKDRSTVTNMLRLLKLPEDLQQMVAEQKLSMGHARALLSLPTPEWQRQVAGQILAQGLSVRQVETLVQRRVQPAPARPAARPTEDPNVRAAIEELQRVLGTRVRIVPRGEQRGKIEIEYYSAEDLDRIYSLIVRDSVASGDA